MLKGSINLSFVIIKKKIGILLDLLVSTKLGVCTGLEIRCPYHVTQVKNCLDSCKFLQDLIINLTRSYKILKEISLTGKARTKAGEKYDVSA